MKRLLGLSVIALVSACTTMKIPAHIPREQYEKDKKECIDQAISEQSQNMTAIAFGPSVKGAAARCMKGKGYPVNLLLITNLP